MKCSIKIWGLIFLLVQLLGVWGCKRESPNNKEEETYLGNYPLGDERNYLYFKPGSMWVYECDSTRELDTQYMKTCYTQWYHFDYLDYEELFFLRSSINEGSNYTSFIPTSYVHWRKNFKWSYSMSIRQFNSNNGAEGTDVVYFNPYDTTTIAYGGTAGTRYLGCKTNFKVLDKIYDTVRVFEVEFGGGFPLPKYPVTTEQGRVTYYWAKNVGMLRMHVLTAGVINGNLVDYRFNWNLKEYNVKQ
jgi:hypothetical protein